MFQDDHDGLLVDDYLRHFTVTQDLGNLL